MASLQLPIVLTKLSYLIDNPWTVSQARADLAGLILADSLIDRNLGSRPITLVGFSLGSRVIFACLRELANRGAQGLIQNVYLFGTPIVAKKDEYIRAKAIVPGRFVNGYATNDWILGMYIGYPQQDYQSDSILRLSIQSNKRWDYACSRSSASRSPWD